MLFAAVLGFVDHPWGFVLADGLGAEGRLIPLQNPVVWLESEQTVVQPDEVVALMLRAVFSQRDVCASEIVVPGPLDGPLVLPFQLRPVLHEDGGTAVVDVGQLDD